MTDQTATQLLTVGIPTVTVLVSILINNNRLSDMKAELNRRFDEVNRRVEDTRDLLRAEMLRVEGLFDARLKHLEDRERLR